jgi:hypothetical protein
MADLEKLATDVRKQLEKGNVKQGITMLKNGLSEYKGTDIYTQVSALETQYKVAERNFNMNIIENSLWGQTSNRVTLAVLDILNDLPNLDSEKEELHFTKNITVPNTHGNSPITITQTIENPTEVIVPAKKNVLFLASNPSDTAKLKLSEEFQIVSRELQDEQDIFNLRQVFGLTADKLHQAMLTEKPDILHFSGHGLKSKIEEESMGGSLSMEIEKSGGLVLQSKQGNRHIVETQAIANLFKLAMKSGGQIEAVLFNACYSEEQAKAINEHIPYVIGMNNAVEDGAAIEFSTGFYRAIAEGQTIELAFEWGLSKVELEGYTGASIPVLHKKA